MAPKNADLHDIEVQLMPLFHEISVLKFRVEESCPEVRARYRDLLTTLSSQYNFVERRVRELKETLSDVQEDQLTLIKCNLLELQEQVSRVGQWLHLQTANQFSLYF